MSQTLALSSTNLPAGAAVELETSSLPGGVLSMKAAAPGSHNIDLLSAKSDAGVPLTATATGGAMGISRTAGTSLQLVGEATSSNAKTDKALFSITMPATYVSGSNFTVSVDCLAAGTGTITGGSTTMTLAAYLESIGVETSLTVSAAQPILTTASVLTFTITGTTSILAGSQVLLEFAMLITSASGANTGNVNSVSYTA